MFQFSDYRKVPHVRTT